MQFDSWNTTDIEERQQMLVRLAREVWQIDR
jgi:hypothetical protein